MALVTQRSVQSAVSKPLIKYQRYCWTSNLQSSVHEYNSNCSWIFANPNYM